MTNAASATNERAQAHVLAPGEVRRNPAAWPGIKADASDTAGLLSAFEDTLQPWQSGPLLHSHADEDEIILYARRESHREDRRRTARS